MRWSHANKLSSLLLLLLSFFLFATLLSSPSFSWEVPSPSSPLMEDKVRLGSTPPSCHKRCNACNPCKAVQVPTMPSADVSPDEMEVPYRSPSNYKPLGWKCRCGNHLFNP